MSVYREPGVVSPPDDGVLAIVERLSKIGWGSHGINPVDFWGIARVMNASVQQHAEHGDYIAMHTVFGIVRVFSDPDVDQGRITRLYR